MVEKVEIVQALYERLLESKGLSRALIYGFEALYGDSECPVAVTIVNYSDEDALKLATATLPYGFVLIGLVEFDIDESHEVYEALDQVQDPFLLKVSDDGIVCSMGLDYLNPVPLNVMTEENFWRKFTTTFRLQGKLLLTSILELPELKDCFACAKETILNRSAYSFGDNFDQIVRHPGCKSRLDSTKEGKVGQFVKSLRTNNPEGGKEKDKQVYFVPSATPIVNTTIFFDQTKCNSSTNAVVIVADKSASFKYFEHHIDIDVLVVLPNTTKTKELYDTFCEAVCAQLEFGFHSNIVQQLVNSISAEKPKVFHFWPSFGEHFVSVVYPDNTSLEKLRDTRLALHKLCFVRETRPFFRQTAALFQPLVGLVSPHISLKGKFIETEFIKGPYEYRHYMQEGFDDNGWGCAYRSLQTIFSWFRLQGFTAREVPTHREIQECLVSLHDKPQSFIGSKQWIGSTEVSFVLEAFLGVSCRILSLSNGTEMNSRVGELQSHFRIHGTPLMIGGGVYAHTLIGASCNPDVDSDVNFLVLDPHYTGKDELKTILSKGWVGWKDNTFWSKQDFYNICMPLLPQSL